MSRQFKVEKRMIIHSLSNEKELYFIRIRMHNDKIYFEKNKLNVIRMARSHSCLITWKIICISSNSLSLTQKGNVDILVSYKLDNA